MELTVHELKKLFKNPVTVAAIILIFAFNLMTFVSSGNSYYSIGNEDWKEHVQTARENGAYFKGAITDEWSAKYKAEVEAFRCDPANRVSAEETEEIIKEKEAQGYNPDFVRENMEWAFLRDDVKRSNAYNRYEPVEVSMGFYETAASLGQQYAQIYTLQNPGAKGELLADAALEDYGRLASDYPAYYNYDLGYQWMSGMVASTHSTVGVLIIVALAGIFCSEYTRKTDALLLSTKHGRQTLASAKIRAGLIFAIGAWAVIMGTNASLTTLCYGWEGWEAYWQDWLINTAPFRWNQGTALVTAVATSFFGTIYFALLIMAVSAVSKNSFAALLAGLLLLIVPSMDVSAIGLDFIYSLFSAMPATIMRGTLIWSSYRPVALFGQVLDGQYILLAAALLVSILAAAAAVRTFKNHQVSN